MSEKKPDDELLNWMDSFRNHLDVGESTVIYKTLTENIFRTRMQIKCNAICIRVLNLFSFNVLYITVDSPTSRSFEKNPSNLVIRRQVFSPTSLMFLGKHAI